MHTRILSVVLAALALFAGSANAEDQNNWYVAAGGTIAYLDDIDQTIANAPMPGSTVVITNDSSSGWGGYAAVGRRFGPTRLELEYGRTENDSDSYTVISPVSAVVPQESETDISRFMANAYYDLQIDGSRFAPYVGAGAGMVTVDNTRVAGTFAMPTPRPLIDDSATEFAWQAMAGLAVRVSPRLHLTAQYRWFDAGTIDIEDLRGEAVTLDIAGSHIEFGFRYTFN